MQAAIHSVLMRVVAQQAGWQIVPARRNIGSRREFGRERGVQTVQEITQGNDWLTSDSDEARAIRFLAEHTDVSPKQAKEIVRKHGYNREKLLQVAHTIKAEG
ncbi:MAG: hypothetical protein KL840_08095 [Aquamicrobium sp.]|nr:hypothetical protein [Aquamicrobium sp.]